ncbi:hypothetical protein REPUB_Repub03eG0001700 [Reevesia pubescens]
MISKGYSSCLFWRLAKEIHYTQRVFESPRISHFIETSRRGIRLPTDRCFKDSLSSPYLSKYLKDG